MIFSVRLILHLKCPHAKTLLWDSFEYASWISTYVIKHCNADENSKVYGWGVTNCGNFSISHDGGVYKAKG